jgi:hypothetical protein
VGGGDWGLGTGDWGLGRIFLVGGVANFGGADLEGYGWGEAVGGPE